MLNPHTPLPILRTLLVRNTHAVPHPFNLFNTTPGSNFIVPAHRPRISSPAPTSPPTNRAARPAYRTCTACLAARFNGSARATATKNLTCATNVCAKSDALEPKSVEMRDGTDEGRRLGLVKGAVESCDFTWEGFGTSRDVEEFEFLAFLGHEGRVCGGVGRRRD